MWAIGRIPLDERFGNYQRFCHTHLSFLWVYYIIVGNAVRMDLCQTFM